MSYRHDLELALGKYMNAMKGSQAPEAEALLKGQQHESRSPDGDGPQEQVASTEHGTSAVGGANEPVEAAQTRAGSEPADSLQSQAEVGGSDTAQLQQVQRLLEHLWAEIPLHRRSQMMTEGFSLDLSILTLREQALALRTVREERDEALRSEDAAGDGWGEAVEANKLVLAEMLSLRADVERLTGERDWERAQADTWIHRAEHAEQQVRALRTSIEQLPRHDLSVTAYYPEQAIPKITVAEKVLKWAELSALLAAIKEP